MFSFVYKEGDKTIATPGISYFDLLEKFPLTKFKLSYDSVKKLSEKLSLPPGADPSKYMKCIIQFYKDSPTGEPYARFLPNAEFMEKYNLQKAKTITEREQRNHPDSPSTSNAIIQPVKMPKQALVPAPSSGNVAASHQNIIRRPFRRPRLSIDKPRGTGQTLKVTPPMVEMLRLMGNKMLDRARWLEQAGCSAELAATPYIGKVLTKQTALALYELGYAEGEAQYAKREELCVVEPAEQPPQQPPPTLVEQLPEVSSCVETMEVQCSIDQTPAE